MKDFKSGVTRIQDFKPYIKDNIVRHGSRLADIEKKLVGAYCEATHLEVLDDDVLFAGEDNKEDEKAWYCRGIGVIESHYPKEATQRKMTGNSRDCYSSKTQRTASTISTTAFTSSNHEQECGRSD
ncbi:hypothetical protein P692DRAFT_20818095 [Suillus brevipes Sb2]|nr:hypothetical protein P692DRAFT_20818095 [Suillus brevipes Sb2]